MRGIQRQSPDLSLANGNLALLPPSHIKRKDLNPLLSRYGLASRSDYFRMTDARLEYEAHIPGSRRNWRRLSEVQLGSPRRIEGSRGLVQPLSWN